jgi:hypothetical protein
LVKGEQLLNVSRGRGTIGEDLNPAEVNDEGRPGARCIALGEFVDVPDFLDAEPWVSEYSKRRASLRGRRANSHAPLLLNDRAIGALSVSRENPGPLSHKHVALLKTFAVRR